MPNSTCCNEVTDNSCTANATDLSRGWAGRSEPPLPPAWWERWDDGR